MALEQVPQAWVILQKVQSVLRTVQKATVRAGVRRGGFGAVPTAPPGRRPSQTGVGRGFLSMQHETKTLRDQSVIPFLLEFLHAPA